ncbi:unnamed protein product, partial [Mesorhabditis belari]|uniref:Cytochrome P450 n=1 Tax=Mesorhabditis belari TaxID=2138241 RepID=A0AAF3JB32_9BILA
MNFADRIVELFETVRGSKWTFVAGTFPWVADIPLIGDYAVHRHFRKLQPFKDYCQDESKKCMEGYSIDQEPSCFVQAYVQKMQNNEAVKNELEIQCTNVATDFFLAGMETTSTSLQWALRYMAAYPDVQEKCRQEILSAVGNERLPSLADKNTLPYTNATVLEIQRHANIIPLNVFHKATCDTHIGGHPIPEGTLVIGQIHQVHIADPVYPNPEEFQPERFLQKDMKTPNKEAVDRLSPFSIGKRQCAGEGMAKVELFLGFAGLMQRYKFSPCRGEKIDLTPVPAMVQQPQQQLLIVEEVNANLI